MVSEDTGTTASRSAHRARPPWEEHRSGPPTALHPTHHHQSWNLEGQIQACVQGQCAGQDTDPGSHPDPSPGSGQDPDPGAGQGREPSPDPDPSPGPVQGSDPGRFSSRSKSRPRSRSRSKLRSRSRYLKTVLGGHAFPRESPVQSTSSSGPIPD